MKPKILLVAVALSIASMPALAQGVGTLSHGLTEAERTALAEERFAAADSDADGQLTQDEVVAAADKARRLRQSERAAGMIEALDSDGRGTLSLEEVQEGRA